MMKSFLKDHHRKLKICAAFSPGGHYVEIMQIIEACKNFDVFYVAPYSVTTKKLKKVYFLIDTAQCGTLKAMMLNVILSLKILFKERPNVVITTGAEIVIPICYLAKFFLGAKIIFIETFARVFSPSFTGRIIYPIADVFLVQWKSIIKYYGKKAKYIGRVF